MEKRYRFNFCKRFCKIQGTLKPHKNADLILSNQLIESFAVLVLSAVLTEHLGFKLKLYKIKLTS
uniref:Uncharacterized protein n=1 Tax=Tetranychus urticae TaxID=32264 RepID=T1JQA9_TETUR